MAYDEPKAEFDWGARIADIFAVALLFYFGTWITSGEMPVPFGIIAVVIGVPLGILVLFLVGIAAAITGNVLGLALPLIATLFLAVFLAVVRIDHRIGRLAGLAGVLIPYWLLVGAVGALS